MLTRLRNVWRPENFHYHHRLRSGGGFFEGWYVKLVDPAGAQPLALIPGVSRSGTTIGAGLARHFDRAEAARYAFLLGIPAIAGAGLFEFVDLANSSGGIPAETWLGLSLLFTPAAGPVGRVVVDDQHIRLGQHLQNLFQQRGQVLGFVEGR